MDNTIHYNKLLLSFIILLYIDHIHRLLIVINSYTRVPISYRITYFILYTDYVYIIMVNNWIKVKNTKVLKNNWLYILPKDP